MANLKQGAKAKASVSSPNMASSVTHIDAYETRQNFVVVKNAKCLFSCLAHSTVILDLFYYKSVERHCDFDHPMVFTEAHSPVSSGQTSLIDDALRARMLSFMAFTVTTESKGVLFLDFPDFSMICLSVSVTSVGHECASDPYSSLSFRTL